MSGRDERTARHQTKKINKQRFSAGICYDRSVCDRLSALIACQRSASFCALSLWQVLSQAVRKLTGTLYANVKFSIVILRQKQLPSGIQRSTTSVQAVCWPLEVAPLLVHCLLGFRRNLLRQKFQTFSDLL